MKKFIFTALVILTAFSMLSCGMISEGASKSDSIIGRWKSEDGYIRGDGGSIDDLEFFEDGTYDSDDANYSGNYSISGDRLKLQGLLASTITYTFKVDDDTLTFYDDDGELIATYKKVS